MKSEVNVSEIEGLRWYAGRINGIRNDSYAVAILLDRQIRKIKKDYDSKLNDMERVLRSATGDCEYLKERYHRATNLCGKEAREAIGWSDKDAQTKLAELEMTVQQVRKNIQDLQTKLTNAGLKTQNYAIHMNNMANAGIEFLKEYADRLQQYKDLTKK